MVDGKKHERLEAILLINFAFSKKNVSYTETPKEFKNQNIHNYLRLFIKDISLL